MDLLLLTICQWISRKKNANKVFHDCFLTKKNGAFLAGPIDFKQKNTGARYTSW
jgi:hypothetical protein